MRLPGLFISGTDTGVGKTRNAAAIVRGLLASGRRVGVMKPVATSAELQSDGSWVSPDTLALREAVGEEIPPARITPTVLKGDVAPCVAARMAGGELDHKDVLRTVGEAMAWWAGRCEVLVVEGVGGLLCPLAEGSTVADLAVAMDFPLVIVARRGLGTLNHTLLTVEAARIRGLRIAGIVLNGSEPTENAVAEATNPAELIRRLGAVPIVDELPWTSHSDTMSEAMHVVDWWGMAMPARLPFPTATS